LLQLTYNKAIHFSARPPKPLDPPACHVGALAKMEALRDCWLSKADLHLPATAAAKAYRKLGLKPPTGAQAELFSER